MCTENSGHRLLVGIRFGKDSDPLLAVFELKQPSTDQYKLPIIDRPTVDVRAHRDHARRKLHKLGIGAVPLSNVAEPQPEAVDGLPRSATRPALDHPVAFLLKEPILNAVLFLHFIRQTQWLEVRRPSDTNVHEPQVITKTHTAEDVFEIWTERPVDLSHRASQDLVLVSQSHEKAPEEAV
ncbi:hypothetical protein FRAHR75_1220007 [Frankia sp. Hr75.2]|nr:hypothetical protein FRAHR75_1220007 [Frankia sp. Hr75.2]